MKPAIASLRDWIPIRVYRREAELFVDWCYAGSTRFTQPFFDDTIRQVLRLPFSMLFRHQTPIEFLGELCDVRPGLIPTGFIFHMSRCGSTLAAQVLAALDKNIVISEARPIDSVLRTRIGDDDVTDAERALHLRSMIAALGQKRNEVEQHYFVKFDSWNALDLGLIRKTFPDVPWIFLYRDPVEVIVSQMRQRGSQMLPGKIDIGVDMTEAIGMTAEEYCARVLARICETALDHAEDRTAMLVNYNQLPEILTNGLLEHFGVSYSTTEIARMRVAAAFDAKTPQMSFEPDSEKKRAAAGDTLRAAAAKWLDPIYSRLEQRRSELAK